MPIRKLLTGFIGLMAATAVLATLAACSPSQGPKHLSVSEFAAAASSPQVIVVDVRTPGEFAAGHLARAINIDVNASDFGDRLSALDKNAHYAVYCQSGHRSAIAVTKMTSAGFTHVEDLDGGMQAWTAAGQPLVVR